MPRLQTARLQTGVFQTVVTVACGHSLFREISASLSTKDKTFSCKISFVKWLSGLKLKCILT